MAKKILKPSYTCPECKKNWQHTLNLSTSAVVEQNEDSHDLFEIKVKADLICRHCGYTEEVEGRLSKFDNEEELYVRLESPPHNFLIQGGDEITIIPNSNDLLCEIALALEVASIKNDNAAWSDQSLFQEKINQLLLRAGREPVA